MILCGQSLIHSIQFEHFTRLCRRRHLATPLLQPVLRARNWPPEPSSLRIQGRAATLAKCCVDLSLNLAQPVLGHDLLGHRFVVAALMPGARSLLLTVTYTLAGLITKRPSLMCNREDACHAKGIP